MMDTLKMPDSLARLRVQGNQAIGEEIVAQAIGAVEIKCGGACWNIDNPALRVERHPRPIVGGTAGLPRVLGPSVVAKFTGMRDGVKRPAQFAGANVVRANVAGRRGESLWIAATDNQQILVNNGWTGQDDGLGGGRLTAKIFAKVDATVFCKRRNGFAGDGVQGVEEIHHGNEDALVFAIGPVGEAAIWLRSTDSRVEFPEQLSGRGIQGKYFLCRSDAVEYTLDNDGARLKAACFLRVKAPGDAEALDVGPINLRKSRIVIVLRGAAICRPILLLLAGRAEFWSRFCCVRDQSHG